MSESKVRDILVDNQIERRKSIWLLSLASCHVGIFQLGHSCLVTLNISFLFTGVFPILYLVVCVCVCVYSLVFLVLVLLLLPPFFLLVICCLPTLFSLIKNTPSQGTSFIFFDISRRDTNIDTLSELLKNFERNFSVFNVLVSTIERIFLRLVGNIFFACILRIRNKYNSFDE